jgi:hypothetical protein
MDSGEVVPTSQPTMSTSSTSWAAGSCIWQDWPTRCPAWTKSIGTWQAFTGRGASRCWQGRRRSRSVDDKRGERHGLRRPRLPPQVPLRSWPASLQNPCGADGRDRGIVEKRAAFASRSEPGISPEWWAGQASRFPRGTRPRTERGRDTSCCSTSRQRCRAATALTRIVRASARTADADGLPHGESPDARPAGRRQLSYRPFRQ